MPLTPFGLRVWLPILLAVAALVGVFAWLGGGWWIVAVVIGVIGLAILSFFRDPIRRVPTDLPEGTMLSPADGTVSAVFDLDHHESTQGPARVIRIFLSVLNVHVNRSPFDAQVVAIKHMPGKYLNAQTEESAQVNEAKLITMRISLRGSGGGGSGVAGGSGGGSGGGVGVEGVETIGLRQVAGMIARTIVCPLKPGDQLKRGEKFGMIMFGSTTELILPRPSDVTIHVRKGDKVRGGLTVIATLKPR